MISVIITAYKEETTIQKAITSLAKDLTKKDELIVIAPDKGTLNASNDMKKKFPQVRTIKDKGEGKPAALNQAVGASKGDILVLTDGDVSVAPGSLKKLVYPLSNKKIGAVSGNPKSINSKKKMLGFWSHLLTNIAHERRKKAAKSKLRFFCTGYFFAIRKNLFPELPTQLLSEDGYISDNVYSKGHRIAYVPSAEVLVKFPTTFNDWIIQKKRSAGGYNQIKKLTGIEMRSFKKESTGFYGFFKHINNIQEAFWLIALFTSRVYLWVLIYKDVNFKKMKREEIWKRVESTK